MYKLGDHLGDQQGIKHTSHKTFESHAFSVEDSKSQQSGSWEQDDNIGLEAWNSC